MLKENNIILRGIIRSFIFTPEIAFLVIGELRFYNTSRSPQP